MERQSQLNLFVFFSNELYLACEQDVSLLDAIYNLLSKAVHLILPNKEVKKTGVNIP